MRRYARSWLRVTSFCGLAAFAVLIATRTAKAGDLLVSVHTPRGAPVADAVVSVNAPFSGPLRFPWPYVMAQQNIQFHPFVLIVPAGADVEFPNRDPIRHHVYSFSPAKSFELKLYGRDETRVVRFDKPGVVQLGCNIHDSMIAYIVVVATPYVAKTDAQGLARIAGVPEGAWTLRVWRPSLKAPNNTVSQDVHSPSKGAARIDVTAEIRPQPERAGAY